MPCGVRLTADSCRVSTGDINAGATTVWPGLDAAQQRRLNIQTDITASTWDRATCDFWVGCEKATGDGRKNRPARPILSPTRTVCLRSHVRRIRWATSTDVVKAVAIEDL